MQVPCTSAISTPAVANVHEGLLQFPIHAFSYFKVQYIRCVSSTCHCLQKVCNPKCMKWLAQSHISSCAGACLSVSLHASKGATRSLRPALRFRKSGHALHHSLSWKSARREACTFSFQSAMYLVCFFCISLLAESVQSQVQLPASTIARLVMRIVRRSWLCRCACVRRDARALPCTTASLAMRQSSPYRVKVQDQMRQCTSKMQVGAGP
jgi:hypothetical protein